MKTKQTKLLEKTNKQIENMTVDKKTLKYAENWFRLNDIPTTISEGKIFVSPDGHFELELSKDEIIYRAELYIESELSGIN
jgi:hypothetical protein